jgi:hypothetical protein
VILAAWIGACAPRQAVQGDPAESPRQTHEVVARRRDLRRIEALHDHDAALEQHPVRRVISRP